MKIIIICVLLVFLLGLWLHDLIMWSRANSKNYNWRMADFLLTSIMIVGVVILSGV